MRLEERVLKIFDNSAVKPDAIVIKNSDEPFVNENFFYVTGLEDGLFEGSAAVLFPDGKIDLIVSQLESEIASEAKANLKIYKQRNEIDDLLKESLKSLGVVGFNFSGLILSDFLKLKDLIGDCKYEDVTSAFAKSRVIKDSEEINRIRKAAEIVDKVMAKIPEIVKPGMFESELAAEINYLMGKNGAHKAAFDIISSFGRNTAQPHYSHGKTRLNNGDFILCDFGASFRRYNSDITRTFVFGNSDKKQKKMHETVLQAQRLGIEMIKPGMEAHVVHDAVDSFIDKSEFKGCFIHSTGHSLGLSVHDGGVGLNAESKVLLEEGMVLTVEPGVYISDFGGIRIEDDVLITRDGMEILTKSSRDLIEIPG
jgi:Xaa-Pro aminopeptidase